MAKGFVDTVKDLTMQRFSWIIQVGSTQSLVSLLKKGKNVKVKKKERGRYVKREAKVVVKLFEMKEGGTNQENAGGP